MNQRCLSSMAALMLSLLVACGGTSAPAPTPTPTPTPPRAALLISPSPSSLDFMNLFTEPGRWGAARQYVRTFSVPDLDIHPTRSRFTSPDLSLMASSLISWNIDFALEVGAVKEWGCTSPTTISTTSASITRWKSAGGRLASLAMDEPLFRGRLAVPTGCGYDMAQTASETRDYMDEMLRRNPGIKIGDIEPWPSVNATDIKSWIALLRTGTPGRLSFFRLDIDAAALSRSNPRWNEVLEIADYCRSVGVPFSIIVWSSNFSRPATLDSDQRFYDDALSFARFMRGQLPALAEGGEDIPIMSWEPYPQWNLPDDAGHSFSQLVRDFGREFIGP